MPNNRLVIIGCGGHAKSVLDVVLYNDPSTKVVFVDKNAKDGETIFGCPVLSDYKITDEEVFVAIGENKERKEEAEKHKNLISIVSKLAYIGSGVNIGKGVFVAHNAHVGILSQIDNYSIINTNASVDHECELGEASSLAPNTTLCGKVKIGKNVFIGAGASIIDKLIICDNVVIGAGAVVTENIEEPGLYVGIPAKRNVSE
jgi:sugar O-acyltransferase (sialic acid O-acetyltransferase NeuD family)